MTLLDRFIAARYRKPCDPLKELEASITAGCARRKIEREGRRDAALRGMGR